MKKNIKWILCALLLATSASAQGFQHDTGSLFWDYRVVITQTCVWTPYQPPPANGFDPVTKALRAPGESLTAIGSGVARFAPGGMVTMEDGVQTEALLTQLAIGQTPITPPGRFRCAGRYAFDRQKMSLTLLCDLDSGDPAIKVTLSPQNFQGYVSLDGQSINLTSIPGDIQTITVSMNNTPVVERQRMCMQNAVAVRVAPSRLQ